MMPEFFIGSVVAGIVLIVFLSLRHQARQRELINSERLALIEKGVYEFPGDVRKTDYAKYLFLALLLIGFGIALILGSFIENDSDMITGGLIFLMPGAGTLLFYIIQSRKEKETGSENVTNLQKQ